MVINGKITAFSDANIDKKLYADLWKEFSFHGSAIKIGKGESLCFSCGKAEELALSDGNEFAFYVTDDGFAVKGADSNGLKRGINALMARIERNGNGTTIPNGEVRGRFTSDFRAVHFCVFPETTLFELDRFLRAAASSQGSVLFPLVSVINLIGVFLVGTFLFKEKPTPKRIIAIVLAVAAIALLKFSA